MTDRNDIIPTSSGVITCKILCLDNSVAIKRYSRLRLKCNLNKGDEGAAVATAKRLSQEKKVNAHSNDRENNRNDNGTGKQSLRTPSRYTDNDNSDENEYVQEDSFEGDDNFQQAPVQSNHNSNSKNSKNSRNSNDSKIGNGISRNGSNDESDTGKSISAKNMTNTVDNLLDNDDAPMTDNISGKKMTPSAPIAAIPRPPTPVAMAGPAPKAVVAPAPVTEQVSDMFHFEGIPISKAL